MQLFELSQILEIMYLVIFIPANTVSSISNHLYISVASGCPREQKFEDKDRPLLDVKSRQSYNIFDKIAHCYQLGILLNIP